MAVGWARCVNGGGVGGCDVDGGHDGELRCGEGMDGTKAAIELGEAGTEESNRILGVLTTSLEEMVNYSESLRDLVRSQTPFGT